MCRYAQLKGGKPNQQLNTVQTGLALFFLLGPHRPDDDLGPPSSFTADKSTGRSNCFAPVGRSCHVRTGMPTRMSTREQKQGTDCCHDRPSPPLFIIIIYRANLTALGVLHPLLMVEGQGAHPRASGIGKQVWVCSAEAGVSHA